MVRAVRPLGSLSMVRGCARIDSRPDTAKIGSDGRVEVHRARFVQLLGDEKRFHTAWVKSGSLADRRRLPVCPSKQTSGGRESIA